MMTLQEKAIACNREVKEAIETIWNELNKGQRKKLLKNQFIRACLERFKISIEE